MYRTVEGDSESEKAEATSELSAVLVPSNHDLAALLYNYIKCNAIKNGHQAYSSKEYQEIGL